MERFVKLMRKITMLEISLLFLVGITSCNFLSSLTGGDEEADAVEISSLTLGKSTLAMKVGAMDYIAISVKPQTEQRNITLNWSYDDTVISCDTSSNWGITITALQEGQTQLKCSYGGYDASCIITVSGYEIGYESTTEPYIYSNTTVLQTSPGITEKVFVSLYGGDASDIEGYTWSIDNNTVATIQPTGQYCLITAKNSGYARLKVTHIKASYPYYIGVYVFADATKVTYITTQNNIITMNQEDAEQTINVSLVNGKDTSLNSAFRWEIIKDSETTPVGMEYNGNKAIVTPLAGGSCTLRVTHPDATYPLDILCRVITVVQNVYILPDSTVVTLFGEEPQTVTCSLENMKDGGYSVDEYSYQLDDYNVAEIVNSIGNQVTLKGKANGSCKLLVSHPKAAYSREVLLIVQGQLKDAIDASCYITTSQNYVRTKVGADSTAVNIALKGGEDGDESSFTWTVKSTAADGISDVIKLETANGNAVHARAASPIFAYGTAVITPNAEGTAVISISHPKILYPTEILVKVLSESAVLTDPLYFAGGGLVRIVNGESSEYTVELKGKNKAGSDDEGIAFALDDSRLSVASSGNVAQITAPAYGNGETVSSMIISHAKADTDKKVLIMTADDEETLMAMKALYADKLYYNITVGESVTCLVNTAGFAGTEDDEGNYTPYDFSSTVWTVKDASIISVEKNAYNPLACKITALKSGSTVLTATVEGYTCDFTITVYPEGTVQTDPEVYFTTAQNVVSIGAAGKTAQVSINAINLSSAEYPNISWESEDSAVASVIGNGTAATISALKEGETVINVKHTASQNTLKIYVRVGSEYVIADNPNSIVYISSQDVLTMLKDANSQLLSAVLVNYSEKVTTGFSFSVDNESVAKITAQSSNGKAYIKPVGSGQAEITISHPAAAVTKKVLVMVGNSEEELAGLVYMTTSNNVVAVGEGATKQVSVSIKNSEEIILDGYSWVSSNPAAVDVTGNGATALLTGNGVGSAVITVRNKACKYALTIIAQCVDPVAAAANPYIQLTSSVLTLTVSSSFTNVTADLVGGSESDYSDFLWTTNDSSTCVVYGQNEVGKLRALKEGTTYITVSHPKASYSAQILVVCDKVVKSECYISVPSSIISMKPTDSSQTITASLINGSTTDKYNFGWSLDVYDVIDFQYSANVCTISPKQSGTCTITLSHPKAAYDQQIIVNVQEYSTFAFPNTNMTVTQGNTVFVNMQVPVTNVTTHIEYSYVNDSTEQKVNISGTKQVAQITGLKAGTCTVKAALIASSTGVVQATADMLVYVKEKATDTVYITAGTTIYTVQKGKSQTLSASLTGTGVTTNDSYNLQWTCNDSDVIQITGISTDGTVTGNQIYITALSPGEALITCSHAKAASSLQVYVVVPGVADKSLSLNKTLVTIMKGSSGTTVKAIIENSESKNDYHLIDWSIADASGAGKDIARVMGNNQEQVNILPVSPGEALLTAVLLDENGNVVSKAECHVIVQDTKSFVFETTSRRVQPYHSVRVKYTVSPTDAILTWTTTQSSNYFEYNDLGYDKSTGVGYLEITGVKIGNGTIYCTTDGGAKGTCTVQVAWDYSFTVTGNTRPGILPIETASVTYSVNPADAVIGIASTGLDKNFKFNLVENGDGTGTITFIPLNEAKDVSIEISAMNPNNNNELVGSKTVIGSWLYGKGDIKLKISEVSKTGNFSVYNDDSQNLIIGDGEEIVLKVEVDNKNFGGGIVSLAFAANNGIQMKYEKNTDYWLTTLSHDEDIQEMQYRIEKAYVPYYMPAGVNTPSYMMTPINNWENDIKWRETSDQYKYGAFNSETGYNDYWGLVSESYTSILTPDRSGDYFSCDDMKWIYLKRDKDGSGTWGSYFTVKQDETLTGKTYSVEEFRSIPWFYNPGTTNDGHVTKYVTYPVSNPGNFGEGGTVHEAEGIVTHNVTAVYETSTDQKVVSEAKGTAAAYKTGSCGTLNVNINLYDGSIQTVAIPVYLEIRKCSKDCKK